ncbi:MAG: hypothetical protein EBU01_11430 [Crocinitomicaceae bacterium]|nr:hypothetical protein [Crocinitomicaceae bacterium]
MATIPFINGKQHAWASVSVNILGRTLTGITSISFGHKKNKENLYGAGDEPIARGDGNKEYEPVKFSVYQFEAEGIEKVAPLGDITSIPPFEIVVQFKETLNSPKKTYVIQNNEFTMDMRDLKQGDTKSIVNLETICAGIIYPQL